MTWSEASIAPEELMRYIDGELPPERIARIEAALAASTELRREVALFRRMKADLEEVGAMMRTQGSVWDAVNRRLTQPVGWLLVVAGTVVWLAYGVYSYLSGTDALWQKLATSAVVIGLGTLLLSALIDRLRDLRTDPYKEIER